jgi:feruloyl esterase
MSNVAGPGLPSGFLAMAFRSPTPIDPLTYDIPNQFRDVAAVLDGVYSMTGSLSGILNYLHRNKKLILFHGWDDTVVPSYVSVNFFNAVQDADDGEGHGKASRNMRVYMAPGVGHCQGGVGADSQDLLRVLTKWVEEKEEPGSSANPVLAWKRGAGAPADISGAIFSRPLCPYPEYPQYIGGPKGNIALASNYACVRSRSNHRRD